jgi:hypothetical protein
VIARRPAWTEIVPLLLAAAIPLAVIIAAAGVLACLPLLLLTLPLLLGRYPGVELIARLAERTGAPGRRAPSRIARRGFGPAITLPRGGRLIASGLTKRPPPMAASLA